MKQKKIPMRTCVVSKEKYPKMELIRVVKSPEGIVSVDITGTRLNFVFGLPKKRFRNIR